MRGKRMMRWSRRGILVEWVVRERWKWVTRRVRDKEFDEEIDSPGFG